jgi:hypothetical protein
VTVLRHGVLASSLAMPKPTNPTPPPPVSTVLGLFTGGSLSSSISTAASWSVGPQFTYNQQYGANSSSSFYEGVSPTLAAQGYGSAGYGSRYNVLLSLLGFTQAQLVANVEYTLGLAVDLGLTDVYLRMLWEANANFQPYSPYWTGGTPIWTPSQFKSALQAAYTAAHNVMPSVNVVLGLDGSPTVTWSMGDPYDVDPGPDYYDSVGFDVYDGNGNGTPAEVTSVQAAWAQSIGKPWMLTEWGLWYGSMSGGNADDPAWINAMADAILNPSYPAQAQFYFNSSPNQMRPNSQAAFTARFG